MDQEVFGGPEDGEVQRKSKKGESKPYIFTEKEESLESNFAHNMVLDGA